MKHKLTVLAAALVGCYFFAGSAQAQATPGLKVSGFGTLAVTHSDEDKADFTSNIFQRVGAGHTDQWSFATDTKLGVQLDATLNDKWSGVVQLISQQTYRNNYAPGVEWANIKYKATDALTLRAGRIALPNFLLSETQYVGYATPWVRPPIEVYRVLCITSNDGVDLSYRSTFGSANNLLQAYYGKRKTGMPDSEVESNPTWGFADTLEVGSFTFRAGFSQYKLDVMAPGFDPLFAAYRQYAALTTGAPTSAQALAVLDRYNLIDRKLKALALGMSYDSGTWFSTTELVSLKGAGIVHDANAWYTSGGYRFGAFTPYASYASIKPSVKRQAPIGALGVPALDGFADMLNAGMDAVVASSASEQNTLSLGVRWDFAPKMAFKAQFDHIRMGKNSAGYFTNQQPGFAKGGKVNVITAGLDFVF
jgi:hypothetical protein